MCIVEVEYPKMFSCPHPSEPSKLLQSTNFSKIIHTPPYFNLPSHNCWRLPYLGVFVFICGTSWSLWYLLPWLSPSLQIIWDCVHQSSSDCSLLPNRYVHTNLPVTAVCFLTDMCIPVLSIKGIHLYYLDCSTVTYLIFHFYISLI